MNPLLCMLTGKIVYGQLHGNVLTTITSLLFFMSLFIVYFISQRPTVTVKIPNSLTVSYCYPVLIIYRIHFVRLEVFLGVHHIIDFALILY